MRYHKAWADFIGQSRIKGELLAFLQGRKKYGLPNIILGGPYGCGKTTLAILFASTVDESYIYYATGRDDRIYRAGRFGSEAIVIDEVHLVRRWENLYPLLAQTCVVGATTRPDIIDIPFLSRCILMQFDDYTPKELTQVAKLHLKQLGNGIKIPLEPIIDRGRGTPRTVVNLAIRLMRYMDVHKIEPSVENAQNVLTEIFQVEEGGITHQDRLYLTVLATASRPTGLRTLSAITGIGKDHMTEIIEPFLLKRNLIALTSQGREITKEGVDVL